VSLVERLRRWLRGERLDAAPAPPDPRHQAADLLLLALREPDVRYSTLIRRLPDIRRDPLVAAAGEMLAALKHAHDDRLDQDLVDAHLPQINHLVNRLRALPEAHAGEEG
jgi:hypothetical protein